MTDTISAFTAGMMARRAGQGLIRNPWASEPGSPEYNEWANGWNTEDHAIRAVGGLTNATVRDIHESTKAALNVVAMPQAAEGMIGALRRVAGAMHAGEIPEPVRGMLVCERANGAIDVMGLGDSGDVVRAIGILQQAIFTLTRGRDAEIRANSEG